ncbi:hypothetical protein ACFJIS_17750 [Variovorax boronicumulans]|uniref:hypothetical protein n=1 Tax=Variovorax boronicumulans TaxID=436515 RepID=UPI0036F2BBBD
MKHEIMKSVLNAVIPVLFSFGVAPLSLAAPGLCWIERIESTQDEVRVSLEEKYRSALWEIERFGGVKELVIPNAPPIPFFKLREGDTARLRSGNHDWCDIVGERRDGVLGVEITAFNRQVGLPLRTVTRFATD